jgi:predicted transcriptional regulator
MPEIPESEIQKKIYTLIEKNPGLYLSMIAELLSMRLTEVEYHLLVMERNKTLIIIKEGNSERYYIGKKQEGIQEKRTSDIRKKIYDLIGKHPGLHLSKIAELLNIRISLAEYHLKYLEKQKKIISVKEGSYYKRYYIKDSGVEEHDKKLLSLLRQEPPSKIVFFLLKHPNAKYRDIQEYLNISAPLLSYHLTKLANMGIIDTPTHDLKGYTLRNKKDLTSFLMKYKIHVLIESFKDIWSELDYYDRQGSAK